MDDYSRFIMPTTAELKEERRISEMSDTEKELYFIRQDMLNGRIFRMLDERYDGKRTCYEDAIDCVLFWARERGEITEEEDKRLSKLYA